MSGALFFIGMPGAGKTEWGRRVASAFGLHFFDLDAEIERHSKETIETIFRIQGEAAFREVETSVLRDLVNRYKKPYILSCGGGTPVNQNNMQLMQAQGIVIYLKASISTLIENLMREEKPRPLLVSGVSMEMQLNDLYKKREVIYEGAHYIFEVESLSISDLEPIVNKCIK